MLEKKELLTQEHNLGVKVANSHFKQQLIKIKGTLTSQIQLRGEDSKEPYHYAFVKLKGQPTELPVIFKVKDENNNLTEPQLKKGDLAELTGYYSISDKNVRKSFTCSVYQILLVTEQKPKSLNTADLITLISSLLSTSLEKKKEWVNRTDFLFKKLEELKEIETLTKLGNNFIEAYLLLKSVSYANYQSKHLLTNFNLERYLQNIHLEIQRGNKVIEIYQSKQLSHHE